MTEKQKTKQYLDSTLSDFLQETLERRAKSYKSKGFEKQAKKVRAFKKEVRKMVGSLWATKVQQTGEANIGNATSNPSTTPKFQRIRIGGMKFVRQTEKRTIGIKVRIRKVIKLIKIG